MADVTDQNEALQEEAKSATDTLRETRDRLNKELEDARQDDSDQLTQVGLAPQSSARSRSDGRARCARS
jgi:hypothetical protein